MELNPKFATWFIETFYAPKSPKKSKLNLIVGLYLRENWNFERLNSNIVLNLSPNLKYFEREFFKYLELLNSILPKSDKIE